MTNDRAADLAAAWDALHDAIPTGWRVGRPRLHDEVNMWEMYAWDETERVGPGKPRTREWTAVGPTEAA
jgi:hypothetical protein